jgi:hypothetical protein
MFEVPDWHGFALPRLERRDAQPVPWHDVGSMALPLFLKPGVGRRLQCIVVYSKIKPVQMVMEKVA